jgi:multicomponent Na+:H+ antiporter subunit D
MFTVFSPGFDFKMVPVTEILFYLGMAAMLVGPVLAISQTDIRRMLAYSSVGQIGYIVLGISLGNQTGMVGGLVHLLNHALMKGGLFLVVGAIIYKTGITQISELKGMGKRMPLSMAAFTVSALSMIGVPLVFGCRGPSSR